MSGLRKASRTKSKIRLGLSATSGAGKTYSALLIAYGMCKYVGKGWEHIAVIDTENCSASLYSDLGEYNVYDITPDYAPEKFIKAIKECEAAGMHVIIVDSITHEWEGEGGCLEIQEKLTNSSKSGNSYTAWAKVTPRHRAFVNAMLQSSCHIITTVRRKQDYEMVKDGDKVKVQKAGLKEITRDGFEYELTINLQLEQNHYATASKDRTRLFMDKPEFIPSEETGRLIAEWCQKGLSAEEMEAQEQAKFNEELSRAIDAIDVCEYSMEVASLKDNFSEKVITSEKFRSLANAKYKTLKEKEDKQNESV